MTRIPCRLTLSALLMALILAVAGCGSDTAQSASDEAAAVDASGAGGVQGAGVPSVDAPDPQLPITFTGDDGVEITVTSLDRVLVLDDATMEIMAALGMADTIGIAPETSLIEDVAANADERITTAGRGSLTVEGVVALEPTLVIGTSMRRHGEVITGLQDAGIPATLIDGTQLAPQKIGKTAAVLGVPEAGAQLADAVQKQFDQAAAQLDGVTERPRVMILSSSGAGDSGATTAAGQQTPAHQVIVQAGGLNTGAESGLDRYQSITAEGLIAAAPEVIVVASSEIDDLGGEDGIWGHVKGLRGTPAAQSETLIVMDDMQLKGGGISAGVGILDLQSKLHQNA
ncbi:heme/hemin ABC transporter substrate-binding protein [Tomitella cavernea]|uniref:Fe/B12 periplasmic-binding domain-containing protein n=1 Tax=Tomitella cavernea TaxID=1387982 RepID=A0ABP9CQ06_9ACTN|nr:ABC transporter substrate-binding protein [Tomitella cavernea]